MEGLRRKRSTLTTTDEFIRGYTVSISNDGGTTFSEGQDLFIYDSNCVMVNENGGNVSFVLLEVCLKCFIFPPLNVIYVVSVCFAAFYVFGMSVNAKLIVQNTNFTNVTIHISTVRVDTVIKVLFDIQCSLRHLLYHRSLCVFFLCTLQAPADWGLKK